MNAMLSRTLAQIFSTVESNEMTIRRLPEGGVVGRYSRMELGSVFQAIVASCDSNSAAPAKSVAYEALIRIYGRGLMDLSPWILFSMAAKDDDLVSLDRFCRMLHVLNFQAAAVENGALFLNVHGRLLLAIADDHGLAFRRVLDALKIRPERVVIETPPSVNQDRKLLAFIFSNYRMNGFRVAANTAGLIDLEELLRVVRPEYVKIDIRHLNGEREVVRAIEIAKHHDVWPIFTRVESASQVKRLNEIEGVWLQGWAIEYPRVLKISTPDKCAA